MISQNLCIPPGTEYLIIGKGEEIQVTNTSVT